MWERPSSAGQTSERYAARRRLRRRRAFIASIVLLILLLGGLVYGLNQDAFRISTVTIYGADQSLSGVVIRAMEGRYWGVIPRNSTLFYSGSRIRADIKEAYPGIAAVSLFRNGFTGLTVHVHTRTPIARWCGVMPVLEPSTGQCYVFDADGALYDAYASTTDTINKFALYAPIDGSVEDPMHASLQSKELLPDAFDFARQVSTFHTAVTHIVIHDGEADDYLANGTRITYVLGNEQNAFNALSSARTHLDLSSGSLEYVDVRFEGKVYVKKKSLEVEQVQ